MIQISKPQEILTAYTNWLRIDKTTYWAMASQRKPFVQTHVSSSKGLHYFRKDNMDHYLVPTSITYPTSKLEAGVVLTKNTWEILTRNLVPNLQQFLMEYLKKKHPKTNLSKGDKYNSNDLYINGKKVFGELSFTRAGNIYYACMINCELTKEDVGCILKGLEKDKNFYPEKIRRVSGIKNEIPDINIDEMLETIEEYLFNLAGVPEYIIK